jgi:hypothetical protein
MDILDDELLNLFKSFQKHGVRYVLVGGFATNLHGYQRTTGDVDLWLEDNAANRLALRASLNEAGLGDLSEIETVPFIAGYTTILLDSGISLDLMATIKGFGSEDFERCYSAADVRGIHGTELRFINIAHLLQAKRASARPKDLADIEELEKIRDRKKN